MADDHGIERTEAASPRWVAQARERGQFPRSPELVVACTMLAGVLAIKLTVLPLADQLLQLTRIRLATTGIADDPIESLLTWRTDVIRMLPLIFLLVGVPVLAAVVASLGQIGLQFNPAALVPSSSRFDLIGGVQGVFSLRRMGGSLASAVKWSSLCALAVCWLWSDMAQLGLKHADQPAQLVSQATGILLGVATKISFALVAFGLIDYGRAWWSWHRQMRMSRAELAAELREAEGDPTMRRRRRQRQIERALGRTDKVLRAGDLVFLGNGRLAVAVRAADRGPGVLLAKAIGTAADRLKHTARQSGAKLIQNDATTRALYRSHKVGDQVSAELHCTIATATRPSR